MLVMVFQRKRENYNVVAHEEQYASNAIYMSVRLSAYLWSSRGRTIKNRANFIGFTTPPCPLELSMLQCVADYMWLHPFSCGLIGHSGVVQLY